MYTSEGLLLEAMVDIGGITTNKPENYSVSFSGANFILIVEEQPERALTLLFLMVTTVNLLGGVLHF